MRAALSHEFKSIIPTYDERPRTKWIFENSVQNTVVVSRLFFTQEVGRGWAGCSKMIRLQTQRSNIRVVGQAEPQPGEQAGCAGDERAAS